MIFIKSPASEYTGGEKRALCHLLKDLIKTQFSSRNSETEVEVQTPEKCDSVL